MTFLPLTPELSRLVAALSDAGATVEMAVRVGSDTCGWAEVRQGAASKESGLEPVQPFDPAAYYSTLRDAAWPLIDDAAVMEGYVEGHLPPAIAENVDRSLREVQDRLSALVVPLLATSNTDVLSEWLNAQVAS